jgi:hypothetical protein
VFGEVIDDHEMKEAHHRSLSMGLSLRAWNGVAQITLNPKFQWRSAQRVLEAAEVWEWKELANDDREECANDSPDTRNRCLSSPM